MMMLVLLSSLRYLPDSKLFVLQTLLLRSLASLPLLELSRPSTLLTLNFLLLAALWKMPMMVPHVSWRCFAPLLMLLLNRDGRHLLLVTGEFEQ